MEPEQSGVEWLTAVLAPWAISPHPNFPNTVVAEPAKLALVTEMRDRSRYDECRESQAEQQRWAGELVNFAAQSLNVETQQTAVIELANIAANFSLPAGARAAAALYATVGYCELERHDEAIRLLAEVVNDLEDRFRHNDMDNSSCKLILSSLILQRVFRLVETAQFDLADQDNVRLFNVTPAVQSTDFDHFEVSRGISWGSSTVQRDIIKMVRDHGSALKATIHQASGTDWTKVVRNRSGWINMRIRLKSADRDELVLRDSFEQSVEASSSTRYFGRSTPESEGYKALLMAELAGNPNLANLERSQLGKVIILRRGLNPERAREGLRLLRQGRSTRALQSAVSWLKGNGPTDALVVDARIVIEKINRMKWCTEEDLLVIRGASGYLSVNEIDQGIIAAFKYAETPKASGLVSHATYERMWRTVATLLPGSSLHAEVAEIAFKFLSQQSKLDQALSRVFSKIVRTIAWNIVPSRLVENWVQLGVNGIRNSDTEILFRAIDSDVRGVPEPTEDTISMDLIARVVDQGYSDDVTSRSMGELNTFLIQSVKAEGTSAREGSISVGGYQSVDVAVAYSIKFGQSELWPAIVEFICDERIDASLKDLAVERLARNFDQVPESVIPELQSGYDGIRWSTRHRGLFGKEGDMPFTAAVRLGSRMDLISEEDLMKTVLHMASSDVKARMEAARTLPFCFDFGNRNWVPVLLLQLSHDGDPDVRASAGSGLVDISHANFSLSDMVFDRVKEMLLGDGTLIPLEMLRAISVYIGKYSGAPRPELSDVLMKLSETSPNRNVREGAEFCLSILV